MKIYTKTGDRGDTGLIGGQRVAKDSIRVEAYGTVDELNAVMGMALTEVANGDVRETLLKIQNQLFVVGCDLATPSREKNIQREAPSIPKIFYEDMEKTIDRFTAKLPPLKKFILPGGAKSAATLHLARAVCRRAERKVVTLSVSEDVNANVRIYLNRLSDLLFVLARYENLQSNTPERLWEK